jgi:hypothetical protein
MRTISGRLNRRASERLTKRGTIPFRDCCSAVLALGLLVLLEWHAGADAPRIGHIEKTPDYMLIHFESDGIHTCTLQYINSFPTNSATANWSNLYVVPNFFPATHFIYPDSHTNRQRFYRLQFSP